MDSFRESRILIQNYKLLFSRLSMFVIPCSVPEPAQKSCDKSYDKGNNEGRVKNF